MVAESVTEDLPHDPAPVELNEGWPGLSPEEKCARFFNFERDQAEEFFLGLGAREQALLVLALPARNRRQWLRLLAPDDAADVLQEMPVEERDGILQLLDKVTRREVAALLAYAEDEAGGLMSPRYVRIRPEINVDEAMTYLRRQAHRPIETINYTYVLNQEQHLLGVVSFRDLFLAPGNKLISDIMIKEVVTVSEYTKQEEISLLLKKHNLIAIPVVDANQRLVGIVTVDDIIEAIEEEVTEDIHKFGGTEALDAPYMDIGFWSMIKKRAGWLSILFVGEMFTATAMTYFEHEIARAVVLSLFIPLVISSGGNSGSQASTLVVRAIALNEIKLRHWYKVLMREIAAGLVLGCILGSIGLLRILLWPNKVGIYGEHYPLIAGTVCLSLVGVVLWGTIAGAMLPMLLKRAGLDPASASAPFVATIVDVTGLIIYFTVASLILTGVLL